MDGFRCPGDRVPDDQLLDPALPDDPGADPDRFGGDDLARLVQLLGREGPRLAAGSSGHLGHCIDTRLPPAASCGLCRTRRGFLRSSAWCLGPLGARARLVRGRGPGGRATADLDELGSRSQDGNCSHASKQPGSLMGSLMPARVDAAPPWRS